MEYIQRVDDSAFIEEFRELRRVIICPICLNNFNCPVTLLCAHTFCQCCIQSAMDVKQSCPICSTTILNKKKIIYDKLASDILTKIGELVKLLEPENYNKVVNNTHQYQPRSPVPNKHLEQNSRQKTTTSDFPVEQNKTGGANSSVARVVQTNTLTAPDIAVTQPPVHDYSWMRPGILVNVLPRTWSGGL